MCQVDLAKITEVVNSKGRALDPRSKFGSTPLMCAATKGYVNIVTKLLKGGSNPNLQDDRGTTALALASLNGHEEIISVMIKNGADPNLADNYGITPLIYAAGYGRGEINATMALIKGGADINRMDKDGKSALFLAKRRNRSEIVKLLQAAGAKSLHGIDEKEDKNEALLDDENRH